MDALSVAASVISLTFQAAKLSAAIKGNKPVDDGTSTERRILKIGCYVSLMGLISETVLTSGVLPNGAQMCVQLCQVSLTTLEELLRKASRTSVTGKLSSLGRRKGRATDILKIDKALDDFIDAVKLLKDLSDVADTRKMFLLLERANAYNQNNEQNQSRQLRHMEKEIEILKSHATEDTRGNIEQRLRSTEALDEKFHSDAAPATPWQPDLRDPFGFTATIIRTYEGNSYHTVARGKLDSGCDDNWISTDIIERAGMGEEVQHIERSATYIAFGGHQFQPLGSIDVSWFAQNASISRKSKFLVHDGVPFDMVLGTTFITKESSFVFDKPALALRQDKLTKEELLEIEAKSRSKGATDARLGLNRRVADASTRNEHRQQKAASRLSTPETTTPNNYPRQTQGLYLGSILPRSPTLESSQSLLTRQNRDLPEPQTAAVPSGSSTLPTLASEHTVACTSIAGISQYVDGVNDPIHAGAELQSVPKERNC